MSFLLMEVKLSVPSKLVSTGSSCTSGPEIAGSASRSHLATDGGFESISQRSDSGRPSTTGKPKPGWRVIENNGASAEEWLDDVLVANEDKLTENIEGSTERGHVRPRVMADLAQHHLGVQVGGHIEREHGDGERDILLGRVLHHHLALLGQVLLAHRPLDRPHRAGQALHHTRQRDDSILAHRQRRLCREAAAFVLEVRLLGHICKREGKR